ncbi:(d)CMP kinase [Rhodohalobacter sp. 8-1]|uniref:(d)CMP kinase n=1 Tax=Rhodohalobacter sp. 8-1 TaxID=3131972 RepID=UPI0030EB7A8B
MIIVIDGPAGSGKSSTAKALSNQLNIHFLDSGALYRAVTYYWILKGKPDQEKFFDLLPALDLNVDLTNNSFTVWLNGNDVSDDIRSSAVANHVSDIASLPRVRKKVNQFMRELVEQNTFIADGRDLGTAVFPDADLKFYMDASIEERADRRYQEMEASGHAVTRERVIQNLKERDHKDKTRDADPLKKADDAIVIDTTGKTFEEQVAEMAAIINNKLHINS